MVNERAVHPFAANRDCCESAGIRRGKSVTARWTGQQQSMGVLSRRNLKKAAKNAHSWQKSAKEYENLRNSGYFLRKRIDFGRLSASIRAQVEKTKHALSSVEWANSHSWHSRENRNPEFLGGRIPHQRALSSVEWVPADEGKADSKQPYVKKQSQFEDRQKWQ